MNAVLGIDPGPVKSGYAVVIEGRVSAHGHKVNALLCEDIKNLYSSPDLAVVIERVQGYGRPVGASTFETCVQIGVFMATAAASEVGSIHRIPFPQVKQHLCRGTKGKDADIRRALIARWGPQGSKKYHGPLYGVSGHAWAALAIATVWWDRAAVVRDAPAINGGRS